MARSIVPFKIGALVLFAVAMIRLAVVGAKMREADTLSMWLVVAAIASFWALAWIEGVIPGLMFQRKGHEKEFVIIQIITGAGLVGLSYLIATAF